MTGKKISREIFASLPAIDGRMADMSQKERDQYVKQLYINTKKILRSNILIPVTDSHKTTDEPLHASLLSIELRKKDSPTPHYVIEGEIFLDDEYFSLYRDGKYPAISVEISEYANLMAVTGSNTELGDHICAVALLGATPAAMPALSREVSEAAQPYNLYTKIVGAKQYFVRGNTMSIREKILSSIMQVLEKYLTPTDDELIDEDAPDKTDSELEREMEEKMKCKDKKDKMESEEKDEKGKVSEEVKEEDFNVKNVSTETYEKIIDAQNKRIELLENSEIERQFNALINEGRVIPEDRESFFEVVKIKGIDFASQIWSRKITPLGTPDIISESEKESDGEYRKKLDEQSLYFGWSDETKKAHYERVTGKKYAVQEVK